MTMQNFKMGSSYNFTFLTVIFHFEIYILHFLVRPFPLQIYMYIISR